jgi:hypothetical protein
MIWCACALRGQGPAAQSAKPGLRLLKPVLSQFEDGEPVEPGARFTAGETVFFSVQVEGYRVDAAKVRLTGHVQAFDPGGTPIAPIDEMVIGTSLSEEDRNWKPRLRSQIQVPPIAPGGTYTIRYDATDDQSHATASGQLNFEVAGRRIEPSPELAVRDLAFYRSQDEEAPLAVPAYRPGDMVWVKFVVTGYKHGEQNAIDVSYDVAVTTSEGKQLFAQEDAAVEKNQAFYPQPWVAGIFNLTLQSNMRAGVYTVTITAHDGIGKQTANAKMAFKVE